MIAIRKISCYCNPNICNVTSSIKQPGGLINLDVHYYPNITVKNLFVSKHIKFRFYCLLMGLSSSNNRLFPQIKVSAQKRDEDDLRYKTFLNINNVTIDYCAYMTNHGLGAFLVDIFAKNLAEHGNLIQRCPLRGHLYLRNYTVDLTSIPFFVPKGEYSAQMLIYMKNSTTETICSTCMAFVDLKPRQSRS